MRILLTANASYVPPRGGATRSNLVWLDQLAACGHACRIVASTLGKDEAGRLAQLRDEGIDAPLGSEEGVEVARRGRILIYSTPDPARRNEVLRQQVLDFQPDWVLVSSEDVGHVLVREADRLAPGRVVYLAHTPQFFPFGPESWNPDAGGTEALRRAAAIVVIGRHMAGYVERHLGRRAEVIHPPMYGSGPFRNCSSFASGLITMINPCAVKGIEIFLALADRLPQYTFGALPGWGTTAADRSALEARPNVRLLPNCRDIEELLSETRVLLMPSLWYEGFGLIVMEAMLRGIPVVASDSGGLVEAKMGTRFIVPVRPAERYEPVFDERGMPKPVAPPQELAPWVDALGALLSDRQVYEREAEASRQAALQFVKGIRPRQLEEFLLSQAPAVVEGRGKEGSPMRILLAQNSPYFPAHGGGDKSNRLLIEALAARGHVCRVVARTGGFGEEQHRNYLRELAARSQPVISSESGAVVFRLNGVEVHVLTNHRNLRAYFAAQIVEFRPSVILSSTDDPAQLLLEAALRAEDARVVYLTRTTLAVPFGPDCAFPSAAKTALLKQADAVAGVSRYVAGYIRKWSGIDAVALPISLLEPGPYPALGRFENEFVTLVNPCAVKGISIFLKLAEMMPEVRFAAVPTWGTNEKDQAALKARPNVCVLDPVDNIDELLARTRVLLVPSLWAEARSRIVVEALIRGVPVLASDVGGIPEAMMGVDYLLPVRPIEKYRAEVDEQMVPVAEVPEQDVGPWHDALAKLLSNRAHYEELSRASRAAALNYASNLTVEPFERFLQDVVRSPKRARPIAEVPAQAARKPIDELSPEKRRLLALRLRKKASAANVSPSPWFPALDPAERPVLRLFCFPHAGGGHSAFRDWSAALPPAVSVCPVRYPGRETRLAEPPFERMAPLVEALEEAILPCLSGSFAFFGHSMGAVIAFELARRLRKNDRPMPSVLFASGARAPQFRLNHVPPPDPAETELIEELRRLEGIPLEVLENPELRALVMPALRADAALYRNYIYVEEPPLDIPIRVYGGLEDANVTRAHLEAWACQTTRSFAMKMFPGGHFFVHTAQEAFLAALKADIGLSA